MATIGAERIGGNGYHETKELVIKSWSQIEMRLPKNFDPNDRYFLRDYFRAQLRVAQGRPEKAKRIFAGLTKRPGYDSFEEKCESYLAAVDLAVKKETRWHSKPAFTIDPKSTF